MKIREQCCEKYLRKPKVCKDCPLVAGLNKKQRRKWLKREAKRRRRAA